MAQDPESVRKKRRCSADTVKHHVQVLQNETDLIFAVRFGTILCLRRGSVEISRRVSCAGLMNEQVLSGSSQTRLTTKRE